MTEKNLVLLPAPRQLTRLDGSLRLEGSRLILLDDSQPKRLRLAALRLGEALQSRLGQTWEMQAGLGEACQIGGATLQVRPAEVRQDQGYRLEVTPTGIHVQGHDPAGVFYGVCTLIQLIQSCGGDLPCLKILDWPDFPARGVMLDISRDKVPSMQTLRALVDRLAGWKVNQLQL